jgi:hypothetical protein
MHTAKILTLPQRAFVGNQTRSHPPPQLDTSGSLVAECRLATAGPPDAPLLHYFQYRCCGHETASIGCAYASMYFAEAPDSDSFKARLGLFVDALCCTGGTKLIEFRSMST